MAVNNAYFKIMFNVEQKLNQLSIMKKKFALLTIALLSVIVLSETKAEQPANSYGGLCCQIEDYGCQHPIGIIFDDAIWMKGLEICPPGGVH